MLDLCYPIWMFKKADFESLSSMKEIQQMRWRDFEWFCKFFLESIGYEKVSVTPGKYDGGIDNIAYKNGDKFVTQVKHWNRNGSKKKNHVPVEIVRALYGSMKQKEAKNGIIIATVPSFEQANMEAKNLGIEIIDLDQLKKIMLQLKPHFDATEYQKEINPKKGLFRLRKKDVDQLEKVFVLLFLGLIWFIWNAYFRG